MFEEFNNNLCIYKSDIISRIIDYKKIDKDSTVKGEGEIALVWQEVIDERDKLSRCDLVNILSIAKLEDLGREYRLKIRKADDKFYIQEAEKRDPKNYCLRFGHIGGLFKEQILTPLQTKRIYKDITNISQFVEKQFFWESLFK